MVKKQFYDENIRDKITNYNNKEFYKRRTHMEIFRKKSIA